MAAAMVRGGSGGRSTVSGKRAVVFGAYGFVGRYIVQRLARQGTQVVIPYRCDPYNIRHLRPTGDLGVIRPVFFDSRNDNDLHLLTEVADTVYNLVGQDKETPNWDFDQVHEDFPSRLAAIAQANKVERFIHMSSVGVDEESPSKFYASKAKGEKAVQENFPLATIIRSARIFGPEDKYTNRISTLYQRYPRILPLPYPDGGSVLRCPIYVGDVAQAMVEAMAHKEAPGQVYELLGPEQCSLQEFTSMVSEVIMRDRSFGYVPYPVLKAVGPAMHPLGSFIAKTDLFHGDVISQQIVDEIPSTYKGLAELGVTPTPFASVALRWLRRFRPPHFHTQMMSDEVYKVTHK